MSVLSRLPMVQPLCSHLCEHLSATLCTLSYHILLQPFPLPAVSFIFYVFFRL